MASINIINKKQRDMLKLDTDGWFSTNVSTITEVKKLLEIMFNNESNPNKTIIMEQMKQEEL